MQLQLDVTMLLPPVTRKRPGPAKPKHGISQKEWSDVVRRVVENQESLRTVAKDYDVSYETVRRVLLASRQYCPKM